MDMGRVIREVEAPAPLDVPLEEPTEATPARERRPETEPHLQPAAVREVVAVPAE